MENTKEKKSFNRRAFTSIGMFTALLALPISGICIHNLQFAGFSMEKHFWMSVHNMAAFLFLVFSIIHVAINWRALMNYIHKVKGAVISKEAVSAILLVAGIVILFSSHALHAR